MFIQTEETPNPATLKFLPGVQVLPKGTADFPNAESAERSPLAQALFAVTGIRRVFFAPDFISITKADETDWFLLKPSILAAIMEHFTAKRPVLLDGDADSSEATGHASTPEEHAEIVEQIIELLDTRIRPAVAQDGGDIVFDGYEDGIVFLRMQGACEGCPSSSMTLKSGIENMMRHYIPEVIEVRETGGSEDYRGVEEEVAASQADPVPVPRELPKKD